MCIEQLSHTVGRRHLWFGCVNVCVCVCTSAEMISELVLTRNLCVYCFFFVIFI